tara:strand:+ start:252 stop:2453 length:2202 start_codon:yes stop_codon:yes gene_type:complete
MIKKLINFSIYLLIGLVIIIFYLSFFGIKTEKFNDKIQDEVSNINKKVNLELKSIKFLLRPLDLSINIKTFEPAVIVNSNKLELRYIKTNISLKSFINKKFSIDSLQISTQNIKLNDLLSLVRSYKNSTKLFILDNIIKEGSLVGDMNLNFDSNGNIKNDYEIKGFIKNAKLKFLKNYNINDLNLIFDIRNNEYNINDIEGNFNQIKLFLPLVSIKEKNNQFFVNGKLASKKNDINVNLLNNLLGNSFKDYKVEDINFSSDSDFSFDINNKLKVINFKSKSIIDLSKLIYKNDSLNIKNYLPNFKDTIKLRDHKITINYRDNKIDLEGEGKVSIEKKNENINYKIIKKNEDYKFNTVVHIKENSLLLDVLEYEKDRDLNSTLVLQGSYLKNKEIKLNNIAFTERENIFIIKGLDLDKKYKIKNINKLDFNFTNKNKIVNQVSLRKSKSEYKIYGKSFDTTRLINSMLNNNSKESSSIFSNLNSSISINIDKAYLDKNTFINNLIGNIVFQKNEINSLDLNSTFQNKKKLTLTISTNTDNEKITTFFSDYPKPLVKKYKFIKGFEKGDLDFYSIKKDGISNSVLKIDDFKVQEVPILAKLLTLASLQGIADILTGEGIRFTDFEMKFSNEKELMKIEEMYAIGPAISILMDGYIQGKELISLRGTLVPATTINKSIASIPLIGKILVGEKTGEGVFGVSFKVKGHPEKLKTTVNPVKTLTPRFITRTLEKIKNN